MRAHTSHRLRAPHPRPPALCAARRAALITLLADHCRSTGQRQAATTLACSVTTINLILKGKYMASPDNLLHRVAERLCDTGNWLGLLRAECARTSQVQAAQRLGCSPTTVSQVLSGTYAANPIRIERRVRGELQGAECECPVMGDVSLRVCQDVQERNPGKSGAGIGNPQHAQAWHACRGSGQFARAGQCLQFNGAGAKPIPIPAPTPAAVTTATPATQPEA